ncbi:MAG: ankyrin repeat domain-containing protein, partial [Rickettsiales bacterium]|nr:ankyrin repeat domain-containing protein [Rickettsiales bacterium]
MNLRLLLALVITCGLVIVARPAGASSFRIPIIAAADDDDDDRVVQMIERGHDVNQRGKFETTALHRAAYQGNVSIGKALIEAGAKVNVVDVGGATPLHIAARQQHPEFVTLLLNHAARVNIRDGEGWSPLMRAALAGEEGIVRSLLEKGADTNIRNLLGETALMYAVRKNRPAVVKLLADNGADPNLANNSGETALEMAKSMGDATIIEIINTVAGNDFSSVSPVEEQPDRIEPKIRKSHSIPQEESVVISEPTPEEVIDTTFPVEEKTPERITDAPDPERLLEASDADWVLEETERLQLEAFGKEHKALEKIEGTETEVNTLSQILKQEQLERVTREARLTSRTEAETQKLKELEKALAEEERAYKEQLTKAKTLEADPVPEDRDLQALKGELDALHARYLEVEREASQARRSELSAKKALAEHEAITANQRAEWEVKRNNAFRGVYESEVALKQVEQQYQPQVTRLKDEVAQLQQKMQHGQKELELMDSNAVTITQQLPAVKAKVTALEQQLASRQGDVRQSRQSRGEHLRIASGKRDEAQMMISKQEQLLQEERQKTQRAESAIQPLTESILRDKEQLTQAENAYAEAQKLKKKAEMRRQEANRIWLELLSEKKELKAELYQQKKALEANRDSPPTDWWKYRLNEKKVQDRIAQIDGELSQLPSVSQLHEEVQRAYIEEQQANSQYTQIYQSIVRQQQELRDLQSAAQLSRVEMEQLEASMRDTKVQLARAESEVEAYRHQDALESAEETTSLKRLQMEYDEARERYAAL